MRLSFDVPIKYLKEFEEYQDFDVCSAVLAENYTEYFKYYRRLSEVEGGDIILHDGVLSGYKPVSMPKLLDLAVEVGVTEIVIPFKFRNIHKTIDSALKFFKLVEKRELQNKFVYMAVPQGKTIAEIVKCQSYLVRFPVNTVGLNVGTLLHEKAYRQEQFRLKALQVLKKENFLVNRQIHLFELGAIQFLKVYKKAERFFNIRSLNTCFPVAQGMAKKTFDITTKKPLFFQHPELNLELDTRKKIHYNIEWMKNESRI